jgi:hypothetical protein
VEPGAGTDAPAPDGGALAGLPGVPKSTVGASRFPGFVTWKYFFSFAPVIFAVSTAGNCRRYALYSRTAGL